MNKFFILPLILAFASVSFAASPYFSKGYVHINGSLAANGTIVEVFLNGTNTPLSSAILGHGQLNGTREGWYVISFEANAGDIVVFRVNNLTLISANGTNTSAQTLISGGIIIENFNLSVNTSTDGSGCAYNSGCSSNLCVHNVCRSSNPFCGDGFCDSGESCSSDNSACSSGQACTNGCVTTSTGGGGGGGGGGGAAVSTTSETVTVPTVTAETTATVSISQSVSANLGVEKIEFTPTTTATDVKVTVKETTASSAGVSVAISSTEGAVYKYLEITKTNIKDTDISSAKINFKVPKSWFTSNNIDKSTIALNRFVNNAWSKLPTTLSSEDATYVYFSATSTGFSVFAITGEKAKPTECGNSIINSGEECDGTNLGQETCMSRGFARGTLSCASCRFDTSGCISYPTLTITSPTEGQAIYDTTVTVSVSAANINLVPATSTVVEGEGHLHLYLDNRDYVLSTGSYEFTEVPFGQHTLRAVLHRGDHSPFDPPVVQTIAFTTSEQPAQPPAGKPDYTPAVVAIIILIILIGAAFMFLRRPKHTTHTTHE